MNISASDLLTTRKLLYIIIYKLNIIQRIYQEQSKLAQLQISRADAH